MDKKVAIVTGACNTAEIGLGIVKALAQLGTMLVIADPVPQDDERAILALQKLVSAARAAGAEAIGLDMNINDQKQVTKCVDRTRASHGRIDVLVNITRGP